MPPDCSGASFVFTKFNPMSRLSGIVAGNLALKDSIKGEINNAIYRGDILCLYKKVELPQ